MPINASQSVTVLLTDMEWNTLTSKMERAMQAVTDLATLDEIEKVHGDLVTGVMGRFMFVTFTPTIPDRMPYIELECCQPVRYPTPGNDTQCSICGTTFHVA